MLNDSQIWVILEEKHNDGLQYLLIVDSGKVNSENMKGSSVFMKESTPNMYASSLITGMLDLNMLHQHIFLQGNTRLSFSCQ